MVGPKANGNGDGHPPKKDKAEKDRFSLYTTAEVGRIISDFVLAHVHEGMSFNSMATEAILRYIETYRPPRHPKRPSRLTSGPRLRRR